MARSEERASSAWRGARLPLVLNALPTNPTLCPRHRAGRVPLIRCCTRTRPPLLLRPMRRLRTPKKLTTWLCLVTYLLTGTLVAASELVLCVGPGWHIAFEVHADAQCFGCGTDVASPPSGASLVSAADEACPCVDVPLASRSGDAQTKPSRSCAVADSLPSISTPVLTSPFAVPASALEHRIVDVSRLTSSRSHLRTVVLLV